MNHWFEVHKARAWCCWKMQRCSWTLLQLHIVVFPSARRIRICDRIQECTKVRITFRHHICDALEMEVKNLKQKKYPKTQKYSIDEAQILIWKADIFQNRKTTFPKAWYTVPVTIHSEYILYITATNTKARHSSSISGVCTEWVLRRSKLLLLQ